MGKIHPLNKQPYKVQYLHFRYLKLLVKIPVTTSYGISWKKKGTRSVPPPQCHQQKPQEIAGLVKGFLAKNSTPDAMDSFCDKGGWLKYLIFRMSTSGTVMSFLGWWFRILGALISSNAFHKGIPGIQTNHYHGNLRYPPNATPPPRNKALIRPY